MRLNTYINFNGTCAEAFRFYEKHLEAKVGMAMTHEQVPDSLGIDSEWRGKVLHGRIVIGDNELMAADIPKAEPMRSAYLTLRVESDQEAERIFSALSEGGQVLMQMEGMSFASHFGQVRDRFGINWMIPHERAIAH